MLDELTAIAVEHVRYCRRRGDSFADIIASVGRFEPANSDGAVVAIAQAQAALNGVSDGPD